MTFRY